MQIYQLTKCNTYIYIWLLQITKMALTQWSLLLLLPIILCLPYGKSEAFGDLFILVLHVFADSRLWPFFKTYIFLTKTLTFSTKYSDSENVTTHLKSVQRWYGKDIYACGLQMFSLFPTMVYRWLYTYSPIFWIEFVSKLSRRSVSPSTDHNVESSLSVNCHDRRYHRLPTISSTYDR